MKIKFWGVRGSVPVSDRKFSKFGGNTTCIEIINEQIPDEITIIDAGTGIFPLGNDIQKRKEIKRINILFTHYHWDHIQGLPFFAPLNNKDCKITIYYNNGTISEGKELFTKQMISPFFPISFEDAIKHELNFVNISKKSSFTINGINYSKIQNHHSEGTFSYKMEHNGKTAVFMTDNEIYCKEDEFHPNIDSISELNKELLQFCSNSDVLIHDSQFFEHGFSNYLGWGHSNNASVTYFSHIAKVKKLFLFHFDPHLDDKQLELMLSFSKKIAKTQLKSKTKVFASKERLEISL